MKNKKGIIILAGFIIAGLISGCTSTAGAASSWPGIAVKDEIGYFAYGAEVYAIDAKNGTLIWRYPSEPNAKTQFFAPPAVSDDQVIVGSYDNTLVSLDINNGFEKWASIVAKDRYIATPLIMGDKVFAPNSDKYLYAFNTSGDLLWNFKTEGPNWTQPVTDGQTLFLASMDHYLYALNLDYAPASLTLDKTGSRTLVEKPLWRVDLGAAVVADPIFSNGRIIVAAIDGKMYSIDAASGKIVWTFENGDQYNSVWGSPVVTESAIFLGNEKGDVFAVSLETGKALWVEPYVTGAAVIAGGIAIEDGVLFVNQAGKVFTINADKEPRPLVSLDGVFNATPKSTADKILLAPAAKEKLFMAINFAGNEIWSFTPSR